MIDVALEGEEDDGGRDAYGERHRRAGLQVPGEDDLVHERVHVLPGPAPRRDHQRADEEVHEQKVVD